MWMIKSMSDLCSESLLFYIYGCAEGNSESYIQWWYFMGVQKWVIVGLRCSVISVAQYQHFLIEIFSGWKF